MTDLVSAFIDAASAPRDWHASGTLDEASAILERVPDIASQSVYAAAVLGDEARVAEFLARDPRLATAKGGPRDWDALTYLCFSRYLKLDRERSDAFVTTARVLLDAGADANTGWYETIDHPNPRQILESAMYGAAGIAQHAGLTRLLLAHGADPNDEETPYHVPETRENAVLCILLESKRLNAESLACLLVRKADWHDLEGLRLVLKHGADPNMMTRWGKTALHQAVERDNSLDAIEALLDRGANPALLDRHGRSAVVIAARRGRGDVLLLLRDRGVRLDLQGADRLIAACAMDDRDALPSLSSVDADVGTMRRLGGALLAQFAGVGNLPGVRNLLACGIAPDAMFQEGDGYFGIAPRSTALHVAAWRGHADIVQELIARGVPVHQKDGHGRTALQLAVKACVDSYWMERRSPESVRALLEAGASAADVLHPCGYDEVDALLANMR